MDVKFIKKGKPVYSMALNQCAIVDEIPPDSVYVSIKLVNGQYGKTNPSSLRKLHPLEGFFVPDPGDKITLGNPVFRLPDEAEYSEKWARSFGNVKKLAYYARAISLYGTPEDTRNIKLVASLGYSVADPNTPEHSEGYKKQGMDYFKILVEQCDIVFFKSLPSGEIPAGVYAEINHAKYIGIPVLELPTGIEKRKLTVEETREYLMDVGHR